MRYLLALTDLHVLDNYEQYVSFNRTVCPFRLTHFFSMKRVAAAWRVLIGVWAPKKWEYSMTALAQYTATPIPPANEWITGKPGAPAGGVSPEPPVTPQPYRARRPRSGRVMRHVLRARAEAARSLASFLTQLENGPADKRVRASVHLARVYGGVESITSASDISGTEESSPIFAGWRCAREVVSYLRGHGAKIAALERCIEIEWAAQNSDGELSSAEDKDTSSLRL
jgi:glycerol-3-phosphate O-acyltransferase / dihydroxyacetone phosphate acyltransferase